MSSIDNSMLKEIISVETGISRFRSTSNNWQDYLPILRYIPFSGKTSSAEQFRVRRDGYMDKLLSQLKEEINAGKDISCITGNILKDPEAKLNEGSCTVPTCDSDLLAEIKSICLTMVSAGLDTVPANLIQGLAYLATSHGQQLQDIAFKELVYTYGSPSEAWAAVLKEEKVAFLSALVKETLRYYTVIAMSLPRASIKPIEYQGATIPAGTLFYMNARSADFDASRFSDPYTFNPDRYLSDKSVYAIPYGKANVDRGKSGYCSASLRLRRWISHVSWVTSCQL
jgi:phenylacetate 2-hydroxylase